jgi:hypothetical protein
VIVAQHSKNPKNISVSDLKLIICSGWCGASIRRVPFLSHSVVHKLTMMCTAIVVMDVNLPSVLAHRAVTPLSQTHRQLAPFPYLQLVNAVEQVVRCVQLENAVPRYVLFQHGGIMVYLTSKVRMVWNRGSLLWKRMPSWLWKLSR